MRVRTLAVTSVLLGSFLCMSAPPSAHAELVTVYSQSDDSGEMVSQQATFQDTWIAANLGNLILGKDRLTITFTMKDPNAGSQLPIGVAFETCLSCQNLQTYFFTDADRALLADGAFHTFTVETGTTTLGLADGETPIYIVFFGLSQFHLGTHLKSNAEGTIPTLLIQTIPIPPPVIPEIPAEATVLYVQNDSTSMMTNPQATSQSAYIDSANLGNLNLGQGKLFIKFTMRDQNPGITIGAPERVALQSCTTCLDLQAYYFTDADRALLADQAFHTFVVETGTTSSTYADGTRPVSIGFYGLSQFQFGTKIKSNAAQTIPALIIATPPPAPDSCVAGCASSVLFLPGIEASRLYRSDGGGGEEKLWEPGLQDDLHDLYLNPAGESVRSDVYTKVGDVIDEMPVTGANVYKSFIAKMDGLVAAGTINDWEAGPYDWRLSLDDILASGAQTGSRISYLDATSTPYIIQELKRLAATSQTGKVTIIAHSNGGLVAKKLTEVLGAEAPSLIDKMIFVAVPQAGTPAAVAAALHGYDQALAGGAVVTQSTARTFASTSPMAYHLLPSTQYFTQVDDPIVTFDASLPDWSSRYGAEIHSEETLRAFLIDSYGRVNAQTGDIDQPIQLSSSLLADADTVHDALDGWVPPAGVELVQIAGWGVPTTVSGLAYTREGTGVKPTPGFTIDGDGTVVVPSALWTSTATGVANYWVDLKAYNRNHPVQSGFGFAKFDHSRILEPTELLDFLADQIASTTKPLSDYVYLSTEAPPAGSLRLRYALHSPLTLNLYDDQGNHTGVSTTTGMVEEQIPGTYYTEFGDTKYLFSDASTGARVVMNGYAPGTFTFNIDEFSGDLRTASTTFQDIPTTPSTVVELDIESDITTLSPMTIDTNGDGTTDITLVPKLNDIVTIPLDTTPPEIQITFSTSTKVLAFIGVDDSGVTTLTATTTYPMLKKHQKEYRGIATTTVTARDEAGNTTALVYIENLPSPAQRDVIMPQALAYNGATTTLAAASASYKWRINNNGLFSMFESDLHSAPETLQSRYHPKNDATVIMTASTKQTLPGMVVPYMTTGKGSLIISY